MKVVTLALRNHTIYWYGVSVEFKMEQARSIRVAKTRLKARLK